MRKIQISKKYSNRKITKNINKSKFIIHLFILNYDNDNNYDNN